MKGKIAEFSSMIFGVVIFLAILSIPILLILGSTWAAKNLLQPLIVLGWIVVAIDILILLPLSLFKGLRGFTGTAIFISSFLFGLVTWLLGFILTYAIWGLWAVIAGVLFFGGAVVPFALLATLFNGMWEPFFTVIILVALTFGARFIGILIAERGQ
ncbi:MAG: hypothetical protein KAX63_07005 [Pseudomonas sp.]|nr:hypothetical protein [Pseudomonas sp.]